jgi:hypothetical protein
MVFFYRWNIEPIQYRGIITESVMVAFRVAKCRKKAAQAKDTRAASRSPEAMEAGK